MIKQLTKEDLIRRKNEELIFGNSGRFKILEFVYAEKQLYFNEFYISEDGSYKKAYRFTNIKYFPHNMLFSNIKSINNIEYNNHVHLEFNSNSILLKKIHNDVKKSVEDGYVKSKITLKNKRKNEKIIDITKYNSIYGFIILCNSYSLPIIKIFKDDNDNKFIHMMIDMYNEDINKPILFNDINDVFADSENLIYNSLEKQINVTEYKYCRKEIYSGFQHDSNIIADSIYNSSSLNKEKVIYDDKGNVVEYINEDNNITMKKTTYDNYDKVEMYFGDILLTSLSFPPFIHNDLVDYLSSFKSIEDMDINILNQSLENFNIKCINMESVNGNILFDCVSLKNKSYRILVKNTTFDIKLVNVIGLVDNIEVFNCISNDTYETFRSKSGIYFTKLFSNNEISEYRDNDFEVKFGACGSVRSFKSYFLKDSDKIIYLRDKYGIPYSIGDPIRINI